MSDLEPLLRPLDQGKIEFRNRVAMAPMARNRAPDFIPDEKLAAYYARRAEHGVALIITEASFIDHPVANGHKGTPAVFGEGLAGYRQVVRRVQEHGARIFCQLWHMGAERPEKAVPNPQMVPVSPSGLFTPDVLRGVALDRNGIREVQASFARAARDAKATGFDGIELHGAHGYLIDAFLSNATNRRTDEYGGSFERRLRFAIETIAAVRAAVGDDYPISLRISQWKSQDYGARIFNTPGELESALAAFRDAGIDIVHCSTRRFWEPEFADSPLGLAGWAKKVSGLPTIAVGSVTLHGDFDTYVDRSRGTHGLAGARPTANIDMVVERLAAGEFDMIAVGRALLANPDWLEKVINGRINELVPFTKDHVKHLI